jgi:hypothetical protein
MRTAGKYLELAQGVAEAALLAPLRSKYKLNLNLPKLSAEAKQYLNELQLPVTPVSLVRAADEIVSRQSTMLEEIIGTEYTRWNPITKSNEEYLYPDPRKSFIR